MDLVKFEQLKFGVKINIGNNYMIYPYGCLIAIYDKNGVINIYTIGTNELILSFYPDNIIDIDYRDQHLDIVQYINKNIK